jgi:hypothetical protein
MATPSISFDWTGHSGAFAEANDFNFGELNYSNSVNGSPTNSDFYVPSTTSGQNFGYNFIRSRHVHGTIGSGTVWKVGNGAPSGSTFGHNMYQLNILPDSSTGANGIDTYESGSLYFVNIDGITTGVPVKLESGACGNIFVVPYNSNYSGNVDSSGCQTNMFFSMGHVKIGTTVDLSGTSFTMPDGVVWNGSGATNATLITPKISAAYPTGAGQLGFGSSRMIFGDGSASHYLVSEDQGQTLTNKTLRNRVKIS